MTWWASIFVLFGLISIALELSGITGDESEDDETIFSFIYFLARQIYYLVLIILAVLFFQDFTSGILRICFIIAALYSILFGAFFMIRELIYFIKDPAGKGSGDEEEAGVLGNALGYILLFAFSLGGMAFAVVGAQSILTAQA